MMMASNTTSTSTSTNEVEKTTPEVENKVSAEDVKKLQDDPRFDLPSKTIKTAEDAYYAYLREEIDESELRAVVASFGGTPFYGLKGNLERPDNAYVRQVPEDLYSDPSVKVSKVEERLAAVKERDEAAAKATKEAEKEESK
jgi:hypothetical protein